MLYVVFIHLLNLFFYDTHLSIWSIIAVGRPHTHSVNHSLTHPVHYPGLPRIPTQPTYLLRVATIIPTCSLNHHLYLHCLRQLIISFHSPTHIPMQHLYHPNFLLTHPPELLPIHPPACHPPIHSPTRLPSTQPFTHSLDHPPNHSPTPWTIHSHTPATSHRYILPQLIISLGSKFLQHECPITPGN